MLQPGGVDGEVESDDGDEDYADEQFATGVRESLDTHNDANLTA